MIKPDDELRVPRRTYYHSFLLRYWQSRDAEERTWHLSLEDPLTREVKVFQNVESLMDYLTQLSKNTQVKTGTIKKEKE
jgi:hypothetical protein